MRSFTLLLTTGTLLLHAFITAAPHPRPVNDVEVSVPSNASIPASHLKALGAGIDIHGPIPSDYLSQNGSWYHFAPGSNASVWVRAQIDKPWSSSNSTLSTRQYAYSGLAIGVWGDYNCEGYGAWTANVEYIESNYWKGGAGLFSTGIAHRAMYSWEHLDYSTWNGYGYCGKYLYSAGYETPPGCWNSMQFYCYRLWYG